MGRSGGTDPQSYSWVGCNELVACVNVRRRGFDVKKLLASLPEASPVK
jgi:hypothetical protein